MTTPAPTRVSSLDFLRAFAAYWVVLYHSPFSPQGSFLARFAGWGSLGVDLFFVLSGYLISSQWFAELERAGGRPSYKRFYLRRGFRIWPNYFAMVLLYVAASGIEGAGLSPLWRYLTLTQNLSHLVGFGASWSLCVEEHFYLLFPVIAAVGYRKGARFATGLFAAVFAGGLALRGILWMQVRPDLLELSMQSQARDAFYDFFYRPTFSRLDGLALGVLLAAVQRFVPKVWGKISGHGNLWLLAAAGAAIFAVFLGSRTLGAHLPVAFLAPGAPAGRGVLPLTFGMLAMDVGFALLLLSALCPRSWLGRIRFPGVNALALLSYAIYLVHADVIRWSESRFAHWGIPAHGAVPTALMLVTVTLVAAALYWIVERPLLRLRDRLSRSPAG